MSWFAIRYPYFIAVTCLIVAVLGATFLVRMPVDLFPQIKIPVVVVATFYPGMPPEQIEADLTLRLERFLTLAGGIEHGAGKVAALLDVGREGRAHQSHAHLVRHGSKQVLEDLKLDRIRRGVAHHHAAPGCCASSSWPRLWSPLLVTWMV